MRLADAPQWLVSAFVRSVIAVGATADRQRIQRTAWTLVARWQEPERTFHNLRHLTDVLARVDELAEETHVPDVVRLAAWYHGAVFNASAPVAYARRGGEDAVASADLARTELAALGVPATVTARIHELVTTLDRHDADEHDVDALALCDADLATLAVEPQRYAAYRRAIRAEYAHIPESDYVASRIAILTRLLQRRRLFVSPFSHAWKEPARENLTAELSHLRARLAELGGTELPAGDQPRPHAGAATSWPGHGPTARGAAREAPVTATGGSPAAADMRRLSPPPPSGTARPHGSIYPGPPAPPGSTGSRPGGGSATSTNGPAGADVPTAPTSDDGGQSLSGIEREPEFDGRRRARVKRRRGRAAAQPADAEEESPSALFRPPPRLPRS